MKKHVVTLLAVTLIGLSSLASAQVWNVIKADVPFQFVANGKAMPAGPCTIEVRGDSQAILMIKSGGQNIYVAPTQSETLEASAVTSLVFHRYGDRYFLAGINRRGDNRGFELPAGNVEQELQAQKVAESDEILLASAK
jgi:hypothetical protein